MLRLDMVWSSSLVQAWRAQILLACYNSRWKSEVPLPKVLSLLKVALSFDGPYGYSFVCVCKDTLPKGKRKIWEACAVDWGIAMLCTWAQRAEFSEIIFHCPEDHFSSSPHTARCFMRQCIILLIHTLNICMQKQRKKVKTEREPCVFARGR